MASNLVGLLLGAGVLAAITFYVIGHRVALRGGDLMITEGGGQLFFLIVVLLFSTIPIGGMFNAEKGTKNRRNQMIYSVSLVAMGILGAITNINLLFYIFFLGVFFYSFVSSYINAQEARKF